MTRPVTTVPSDISLLSKLITYCTSKFIVCCIIAEFLHTYAHNSDKFIIRSYGFSKATRDMSSTQHYISKHNNDILLRLL